MATWRSAVPRSRCQRNLLFFNRLTVRTAATTERSPPDPDHDLEGARSLGGAECDLGFVGSETMRGSNIGYIVNLLFRDKDPREANSGFQPIMKLTQEIFDFLTILVLKQLHA